MPEPIQITSSPLQFLSFLPANLVVSGGQAVEWFLYAVFAFWALYTLVAIYHWLRYSNTSWVAFPAIALHLAVSFALMTYVLSGDAGFLSGYLPS